MLLHSGTVKKLLVTAVLLITLLPGITLSGLNSVPVAADDGPDLVVQEITLSPVEPAIDDTVTIMVTVRNQGSATAGQNSLVCYVGNTILATVPVNTLAVGAMTTKTFAWKAEAGTHTIKAIVDTTDVVAESNEINNTKTHIITTCAADLVVQSITSDPASPSRGDTVVFSVVIKNQGNADSRPTVVSFYLDGASRGVQEIPTINPGGTVTRTHTWTALSGQHEFQAVLDELNGVKESDETNNEYITTCTTASPDLVIEAIKWMPLDLSKNDMVSINATVKNQGTGRADACHIGYFIDGELKSTLPVGVLEAGASVNITYEWEVTEDEHDVRAVIDHYQNIPESDETNNELTVKISTLTPDLYVTGITWTPVSAAIGDDVVSKATIKNIGGGRSVNTHAVWVIDNAIVASPELPEIEAGDSINLSYTWVATGGSHSIRFIADYDNLMDEPYENNNSLSVTINVIPADLIITEINWDPTDFSVDENVTFNVTVKNQGGGRADNFKVIFLMDNSRLSEDFISSLDAGASDNLTCTWKASGGRHIFKVLADENNTVVEHDEANNSNSVEVAPHMPDLIVDTISWSPTDIQPGSEITFDIVIKNLGTLNAGQSRIVYYVDDAAAGYTDIGQLDADATVTVQFIWGATAGSHTFDIIADALNKVTEIDETNNTKIVSFPPPDLTVPEITWAPAGATTGDTVSFNATIKNQGSGPSRSTQVTCYVDDITLETQELPEIEAGGLVTKTFDWTALAGGHRIKVIADPDNRIADSDETNNEREMDFATMTPDLVVKNIGWLMEDPLNDDEVVFTITVTNQGTGKAGPSELLYIIDDKIGVTEDVAALEPGSSVTLTIIRNLKSGPHSISATVDSNDEIDELDETGNTETLDINTVAPDLAVKTISMSPATALPGDEVTLTVKLENRGKEKAPASQLSLSVDGVTLSTADLPEIGIGELITQNFTWEVIVGDHEISICADPNNVITESNETNNAKPRAITIAGSETESPQPTKLSSAAPVNKGFLDNWWWLLLLLAALLGGAAFCSTFRSFRKE